MTSLTFRSVVVATGTFAVLRFSGASHGVIELAADAVGTEKVAIGHAKFVAPHVTSWTVEVAA